MTTTFTETEFFKTYIFGGDIQLIHLLAVIMLVDIVTGVGKAVQDKRLWSRKSLFGYMRKLLVFAIIIMSNLIDVVLGFNGALVYATVLFYIANELLSVVENAGQLGLPLPPKLLEVLDVIQDGKSQPQEAFKDEFSSEDEKGKDTQ
ncbi:phage holin family protein [Salinicoccus roseus]|uniref:Phage holin family protein n=1 Tax=Salinicoccus roseus TaxID=45670 RepID=A0A0C2E3T6_9STAP|nr:phage holin family protein [Salinicoccus roseus]KIH70077.1 hypothetical protein SN16_11315 [Salinicoccus roseus]MDB0581393.1 phage holin family protein [Salinicoccus roseus]